MSYLLRVLPPQTREGKPTKELETAFIPVSIGQRREDMKATDKAIGKRVGFFFCRCEKIVSTQVLVDVVVHTDVMVKAKDDVQFKRYRVVPSESI